MRTNYMSDASKILIFAATIIIVCVLCAIGFKTTNEGKSVVSSGTSQLNAMSSEYQDINKSIYDGSTILGSELVNMIKKTIEKEEFLAIVVKTLANSSGTHYNYHHSIVAGEHTISKTGTISSAVPVDKKSADYINLSAQFFGSVYKDENNNVVCIEFAQLD